MTYAPFYFLYEVWKRRMRAFGFLAMFEQCCESMYGWWLEQLSAIRRRAASEANKYDCTDGLRLLRCV